MNPSALSENAFDAYCCFRSIAIWSFTSANGLTTAGFTSVAFRMWKPRSDCTIPLTPPCLSENAASSNALPPAVEPRVMKPRSPPFAADGASCELFCAICANWSGCAFTSASNCSAFAFAAALSAALALPGAAMKMWLTRTCASVRKCVGLSS